MSTDMGPPATVWRRALVIGGSCAALLTVVYLLAVWTPAGQRFEDAVLRAADPYSASAVRATGLLDRVTVPSIAAALLVVLSVGVLRRKVSLGLLSAGVIAASVLTVQVLRRAALRPVLLHSGNRREDQSFPSGHVAVAMSVMCALAMVAPYRLRGAVLLLASLGAASVTVATVTSTWHRPSDTVGSDLIVVLYACAAVAVLARRGRVGEAASLTRARRTARGLLVGGYAGVALATLAVAAVAVAAVLADPDRGGTGTAVFVAGRALALSGSAAVALALLALLRRVDLDASPTEERKT